MLIRFVEVEVSNSAATSLFHLFICVAQDGISQTFPRANRDDLIYLWILWYDDLLYELTAEIYNPYTVTVFHER
jgi:hypothetical protein